jgi:hypothetical protein
MPNANRTRAILAAQKVRVKTDPTPEEQTKLTAEERKVRVEYLYDLLYPSRKEDPKPKHPAGRPRKYANAVARAQAEKQASKAAAASAVSAGAGFLNF